MRKRIAALVALLALFVSVMATASAQPAQRIAASTERVSFRSGAGTVTVYSNSKHQALKVTATSSRLKAKLVSHTGRVVSCSRQCSFKTPFSWGSLMYTSDGKIVTQLNQSIKSERHLPQIRPFKGKDSFVYVGDYGISRIILTHEHDVTFCWKVEAFPGYLSFRTADGKTAVCPADANHGFESVVNWVSVSVYYTGADKPQKIDTLYRADIEAANR